MSFSDTKHSIAGSQSMTETKRCCTCGGSKPPSEFYKPSKTQCKECCRIKNRARYKKNAKEIIKRTANNRAKNKDRYAEVDKKWRAKNQEKVDRYKEKARQDYIKNADAIKAANREKYKKPEEKEKRRIQLLNWSRRNRDKVAARAARKLAEKLRAMPEWANKFFIDEAYALGRLRTEATGIEWHVDHVVPLRGKIVCGLHVERNLQVIPAKVNYQKSNRWWPDMPVNIGAEHA